MADSPHRRWPMRAAISLGVIAVTAMVAIVALSLWTGGKFGARLAAIRAAGDPASIAELAPTPVPPDQNAAAVIDELTPQLEAFAQANGAFYKTDLGQAYEAAQERGEPPADEQLAAIRAVVEQFPELRAGVARAAACPQYASVADFSVDSTKFMDKQLVRIQNFRSLGRFQIWDMEALIGEQKRDEAIARGIELLKLAELHEAEPTLVSYLVSAAVRYRAIASLYDALAAGPVLAQTHAALDVELARQDQSGRFGRVLRTERAFNISSLDAQAAQTGKVGAVFAGWVLKQHFMGVLDLYDALLPTADAAWYDAKSPRQPGGVLAAPTRRGVLADLLVPDITAAYDAHNGNVAVVRSLLVFSALRAFAEKNGREASGLDELNLPKEATPDPFTGKPLKLKLTPPGWLIYSLGRDGRDDGGAVRDQKDVGLGPPRR